MLQLSNFANTKLAKGSQVRVHWRDWLWEQEDGREKSVEYWMVIQTDRVGAAAQSYEIVVCLIAITVKDNL